MIQVRFLPNLSKLIQRLHAHKPSLVETMANNTTLNFVTANFRQILVKGGLPLPG